MYFFNVANLNFAITYCGFASSFLYRSRRTHVQSTTLNCYYNVISPLAITVAKHTAFSTAVSHLFICVENPLLVDVGDFKTKTFSGRFTTTHP